MIRSIICNSSRYVYARSYTFDIQRLFLNMFVLHFSVFSKAEERRREDFYSFDTTIKKEKCVFYHRPRT